MPGRSATPAGDVRERMRTGTRCTTLVKLPVALSGGSSVKRAPVAAGEALDLAVRASTPEKASTSNVRGLADAHLLRAASP